MRARLRGSGVLFDCRHMVSLSLHLSTLIWRHLYAHPPSPSFSVSGLLSSLDPFHYILIGILFPSSLYSCSYFEHARTLLHFHIAFISCTAFSSVSPSSCFLVCSSFGSCSPSLCDICCLHFPHASVECSDRVGVVSVRWHWSRQSLGVCGCSSSNHLCGHPLTAV
jgi:hypothetical protein